MRRSARRPRHGFAALAIFVAIAAVAAPHALGAQRAAPRRVTTLSLSGGVAFPSGGDLNDTYAPGPFVASTLSASVFRRFALRVEASVSSFAPAPAPKHVERDSRLGYVGELSAAAVTTVVARGDRALLYCLASGGRARVGSTWLDANNVVEPYSHADLWSWGFGAGSEVTSRLSVEIQRLTAHRGSRGVVGYVPVGIRLRL